MLEREMKTGQQQYQWPDNYYMETDGMRRKGYLDAAPEASDSRENQLRHMLWEKRYTDARGRYDGTDHFLKVWMDLPFLAKSKDGLFGKSRVRKGVEEIRETLLLDLLKENRDHKEVWYREFIHFSCLYIQISKGDRSYSTTLFGIGKLPEDNLLRKIAMDLCEKTILYPDSLGFRDDQELLARAAKDAFCLYYPGKEWVYEEAEREAENRASR